MYYNSYTIGGELYHHGVEGQKWGVKNGPPYPLDKSKSTGKKLKKKTIDKSNENTKNFKAETVNKMKEFYQHNANYKFDRKTFDEWEKQHYKLLKDVVKTKAMQDFLNNKDVKNTYEKRNKYLNGHEQFDENGNEFGPTTTYGCGIVFENEMKKHADNFFGKNAKTKNNPSNPKSKTLSELMMRIVKEIDIAQDKTISPYYNDYSWLHWH